MNSVMSLNWKRCEKGMRRNRNTVKATRSGTTAVLLKKGRRGRPPKKQLPLRNQLSNEDAETGEDETGCKQYLDVREDDDGDDGIAECVPNGFKLIRCCICDATMNKIYQLRQHMELHTRTEHYKNNGEVLEVAPVYEMLNPHQRNIDPSVMWDFLIDEIKQKRYSQFYVILTKAGVELNISDSETDSTELTSDEELDKNGGTKAKNAHIPRNIYKCELCQTIFNRRHKALFHQRTAHSGEGLPLGCDFCGRQFICLQLLVHHLKTRCESDEQPISCVERFRQHLLKVNLEQFEYLAQARKDLKLHRLTTADKLYSCSVCQKTFLRSEHLTRHKAVHLPDELKMECPVCFRRFNRKDNLRTHMKVHMDEAERDACKEQPPILCQYCGHCFASKSNYVVHMRRRHTGDKPYACDVCGKGFPKSTDLNSHKISHNDERKFNCSICDKTFARSTVLSKHMRMHNGPYHCTYCALSFLRPNELTQHLRHHTAENPLKGSGSSGPNNTKEQLKMSAEVAAQSGEATVTGSIIVKSTEAIDGTNTAKLPSTDNSLPQLLAPQDVLNTEITSIIKMTKQQVNSTDPHHSQSLCISWS